MVLTLIITPLLGATFLSLLNPLWGIQSGIGFTLNNDRQSSHDLDLRRVALFTSIVVWIYSAFISILFLMNNDITTLNEKTYQFITTIGSLTHIGEFQLGLDGLGLVFVLLTTYLIPLSILSTWNTVTHNVKSHLACLLVLESILIAVFSSLDLITFYVTFESVLIPLFIIVGLHGSTAGRTRASMLLFIYTLLGSFFLLLGIMRLQYLTGTTDMLILNIQAPLLSPSSQRWIWLGVFISIAVKAPLFPFYMWLPRAHAESSLAGSILLAGVVLKLAIYAYIRILIPMLPDACEYFRPLALTLAAITLIHASLSTLRSTDTKGFVAMSSVAHMAIVIVGLASGTVNGIQGAVLLGVAHGFVSPALFIIVGGILYDRYHTRTIRYYRGLGSFMPSMKTWFFLASIASMAVPGSLNWIGELLCITGAFEVAPVAGIICSTSVLLGAIYTIWLFNQLSGGQPSPYLALTNDLTNREWTMLVYLIVPAFILGIIPSLITNIILNPVMLIVS